MIPRSQKLGKTLFQTDPNHKVAKQYMALAAELEERVAAAVGREVVKEEVAANG